MQRSVERMIRWAVRTIVRIYYPRVDVSGGDRVPRSGGMLLVANHANSLLDPVMVSIAANRAVRFFAKAPLFETPLLGTLMRALGMLPAYRGQDSRADVRKNLESLERGAKALAAGEVIGIFPEGKSHDNLHVEQIKSGTARMAIQGAATGAPVLIIPIGINYQRKQQFRSAVWLRIGEPIDTTKILRESNGDERSATRAVTAEIEKQLKAVVLHLNEPSFAPFLDDLEVFLPPPSSNDRRSILPALRQRKRIADAMNWFLATERPRAEQLANAIQLYREKLAAAGLVARSAIMRFRRAKLFLVMLCEALWLTFWFPAAGAGTLFHIVPFCAVRLLARKIQDGPTTTALSRLGLGLPIYGLWYAGAWFALRSYFLPWVAWTLIGVAPFTGILALSWMVRAREACDSWVNQWRVLLRRGQLEELRREQEQLRQELQRAATDYAQVVPRKEAPATKRWLPPRTFLIRWASILALVAAAFVAQNSWFKHGPPSHRMAGLNVAGMPAATLRASLEADETALTNILDGLNELEKRARQTKAEFDSGQRSWYRQADDDAVRQLLLASLNYRAALIRTTWKYQGYAEVASEPEQLRCFLASYTAACVLYDSSLKLITMFQGMPAAIKKLNEPEPIWNIPADVYDTARHNLVDPVNLKLLADARRTYREWQPRFDVHQLGASNYPLFHAAIAAHDSVTTEKVATSLATGAAVPLVDAAKTGKATLYNAQRFVSSWIGDTKIREPRGGSSLISAAQVRQLRERLRPGDIILERRNWFLSNAFLPGYWPHSAIYIGTPDQLESLGLHRDERIKRHWGKFSQRDHKGHERVVLEAISEGVVFTTLEHSVGEADSIAVLRPRVAPPQLREAIARAFSHAGKPYDFEFDFFSTDKLVCSELVFRAYDDVIRFPLVDVLGRKTLPPIELVKQCAVENRSGKPQFEVVAFLDGSERDGNATFASEEAFYETAKRPALTWQQR